MDFYGEPVPEDGEEDDDLYDIAAGSSRGRKRDEAPVIDEEPIPDHETIELDFCKSLEELPILGIINNRLRL